MNIFFEFTYGIGDWLSNFDYIPVGSVLGVLISLGVVLILGGIFALAKNGDVRGGMIMAGISLTLVILLSTFWIVTLHPMYKAKEVVFKEQQKAIYSKRSLSNDATFTWIDTMDGPFHVRKRVLVSEKYRDDKRLHNKQLTRQQVAKKALGSTVVITCRIETKHGSRTREGSGFFVGRDMIATNFHVVKDAVDIKVKSIHSDKSYEVTGYLAVDSKNDLAILQIKTSRFSFGLPSPLTVSWPGIGGTSKASLNIGDPVYTTGNPLSQEGSFLAGHISNILLSTICGKKKVGERIQVQIPIYSGNSGGPLLDDRGLVVGVIYSGIVVEVRTIFDVREAVTDKDGELKPEETPYYAIGNVIVKSKNKFTLSTPGRFGFLTEPMLNV